MCLSLPTSGELPAPMLVVYTQLIGVEEMIFLNTNFKVLIFWGGLLDYYHTNDHRKCCCFFGAEPPFRMLRNCQVRYELLGVLGGGGGGGGRRNPPF